MYEIRRINNLVAFFARFNDCRPLSVECNILPQANGSSRVRLESGSGQVLASVKMELVHPGSEDIQTRGAIECSVECWASERLSGRRAAEVGSELTEMLSK